MLTKTDKLISNGCDINKKDKVCRSRGGESCAFDGAMIVLQPIADAAHIVHGPIACCGNSWEGRGTLSSKGSLHRMGFTTDIDEMGIVYGSERKLYSAIFAAYEAVRPNAVFVYATCVSGLIGEDIESVCRSAGKKLGIPVIPVNTPGFVGPKNLGTRIAGEVLLDYVVGSGEAPYLTDYDINLIGEYNIAGDLWHVEPVLKRAGLRILSRITGDASFKEITYAHMAKLNVVVCSRALINIAKEMEKRYGIPYIEVSFFGKTEMSKALRKISSGLSSLRGDCGDKVQTAAGPSLHEKVATVIEREESMLLEKLASYSHLKGKKAVLYSGGVKSWSLISALLDLGIGVAAVGTKKSTFEDEEKMKEILGEDAPLIENVTPTNLLRLMKENNADVLVAGGRNQYLAIKEGFPFVDVNQERHTAYAGYDGLINLAEQIDRGMRFYSRNDSAYEMHDASNKMQDRRFMVRDKDNPAFDINRAPCVINPLKHSQTIGAAVAFQGIHRALPIIHGAQGCTFLAKVLLTKHFREPIALASTKLFTEDVVMCGEENTVGVVEGFVEKNHPDIIGVLTSGLSEVKGDDINSAVEKMRASVKNNGQRCEIIAVSTPDYEGGLETGYANAVGSVLEDIADTGETRGLSAGRRINVLAGSHLTPSDFLELREIIESFGLRPVMLPDLSALDGSREGFSPLAVGGSRVDEIKAMAMSEFTIAIGVSMDAPARVLKKRFGIEYRIFESIAGLRDTDGFMETLAALSNNPVPPRYKRQRCVLVDGIRDAHFYYGDKKVCLALEPDLSIQMSRLLDEMGAGVRLAVVPGHTTRANRIAAKQVKAGDLFTIEGDFDILISNSHAWDTARRLGAPLYQMGFPVYKVLGGNSRVTIGYRGTLTLINEIANLMIKEEL
jgi:nitrogenase molybdenum-cofactor synthesis protein NifE